MVYACGVRHRTLKLFVGVISAILKVGKKKKKRKKKDAGEKALNLSFSTLGLLGKTLKKKEKKANL